MPTIAEQLLIDEIERRLRKYEAEWQKFLTTASASMAMNSQIIETQNGALHAVMGAALAFDGLGSKLSELKGNRDAFAEFSAAYCAESARRHDQKEARDLQNWFNGVVMAPAERAIKAESAGVARRAQELAKAWEDSRDATAAKLKELATSCSSLTNVGREFSIAIDELEEKNLRLQSSVATR